jgi:hypothetical protein
MKELDTAKAISTGHLPSPQVVGNAVLFAMRITGTGAAYREKRKEYVYRNPENYLNDGFLEQCNGLPVIFNHPDGDVLTSANYKEHLIGAIIYPYLNGAEVWGIARVLDTDAALSMIDDNLSTSPTFILEKDQQKKITIDDMEVLIEGNPELLDHVAVCADGVWDKGETPNGILINNEDLKMDDETSTEIMTDAEMPAPEPEAPAEGGITVSAADLDALLKLADMQQTLSEQQAHELSELKTRLSGTESTLATKADAAGADDLTSRLGAIEGKMKEPEELKDEEKAEVADAEQCAEKVTQAFGDSVKHAMRGEHPDAFKRRFSKDYQKNSQVYAGVNLDNVKDKTALSIAFSQICADSVSAANVMPRNNGRGAWVTEQRGGRTIERVQGMSDDAAFSEFRIKPRIGNLIQRGSL